MATTVVRNHCIWARQLAGDPALMASVLAMRAGETITLSVDGIKGEWEKMSDGRDGSTTPGLRPLDRMKAVWSSYVRDRRGTSVEIVPVASGAAAERMRATVEPSPLPEAERLMLLRRLFETTEDWRSSGPYGPRDELYDER